MNISNSENLFSRAKKSIPGGVNSPVRAFKSVGGNPIFIKSAKGAYLIDEDGNKYIDYVGSWGPMLLGHAHPAIVEAVQKTAESSTSFGAPTRLEVEMAELITSNAPNIDLIRMVNSGTEACMSAIRVARGFTGRDKIIKFKGCYHGHADSFLIQAGSGALTFGTPSSPGVPKGAASDTLVADFNNLESVSELFEANKDHIAAVIVEPVAGNMGCIPPVSGFLEGLRTLCTKHGSVLIFDEVMTGFRVDKIGAQSLYNIEPDLTCFGKIIGGGLPVGAYGGKKEIMEVVSPLGPVYQAGTLSGNPLAMAAGYTLLKILFDNPNIYSELDKKGAYLEKGILEVFAKRGIPLSTNRVGSMLGFFLTEQNVVDFESACTTNQPLFNKIFHGMLERGVYLPASAFEAFFLSNALTYEDLDSTINKFDQSLS